MDSLDYQSFENKLQQTALAEGRPLHGSFSLSYRCNLQCIHCYQQDSRQKEELPQEQWFEIIDQIVKAGCLWLVLSGGEPLLRKDFSHIYRHAKKSGLLVSVYTNGSLISDEHLDLWQDLPPQAVEISLYGYSPETYQKITGHRDARDATFAAVEKMVQRSIPLRLKTMLMKENVAELSALEKFAKDLGVGFRFDPMVTPTLTGNLKPCNSRLSAEQIVAIDIQNRDRFNAWAKACKDQPGTTPEATMFSCRGGKISFFVHPDGFLSLCSNDLPLFDLRQGDFSVGWQQIRKRRDTPLPSDHPCANCIEKFLCRLCPPLARMETGSELSIPEWPCTVAKTRYAAIKAALAKQVRGVGD